MDSDALFGFLGDGIKVEIQGPFSQPVTDPVDGTVKQALPFLHKPADSALMHLQDETGAPSASFQAPTQSTDIPWRYGLSMATYALT
ncbi:MAG: hypothetical protein IPN69_14770 [Acidobacteria bacterium]|nr:hypothetical protein [Acidobacteriota bacterium]